MCLELHGPRGRQVGQGRHRTAPDTDWVNGPNQLWDWDITYLPSLERGVFFYLYSLLDHWSRKNIAWLIADHLSSALVQTLWDRGLINEALLDQPTSTWPKSLSDRGAPMRSHSTKAYFKKLSVEQLFSRPRTPDDNPYIESHFATIKTQPVFPGYFADQATAENYFDQFYPWYNEVHPHTRLHMLTPSQMHAGQSACVLANRAALKVATLATRAADPSARFFTLEELIANLYPMSRTIRSIRGRDRKLSPRNMRHLLTNSPRGTTGFVSARRICSATWRIRRRNSVLQSPFGLQTGNIGGT